MSGTVTRHVNLVSEISKFVTSNKLLDLSECEQTLSMCGREEGNLKEVLTTKGIRALDVKRLICLLYLKRGLKLAMDCEEVNIACRRECFTTLLMQSITLDHCSTLFPPSRS